MLATPSFPCYSEYMEPTHFELTPEQKGMLASLLSETGQPASTLAAAVVAALEEVQQREHVPHTVQQTGSPRSKKKHLWEIAAELMDEVPDEAFDQLPPDGASQHDHYIYGTPKRPV